MARIDNSTENKIAILSFSGGIISLDYLLKLLNNTLYDKVYALFFDFDGDNQLSKSSSDELIKYIEKESDFASKLEYNKVKIKINEKSSDGISKIKDSELVNDKKLFLQFDALISLAQNLIEQYNHKEENLDVDIHYGIHSDILNSEQYEIVLSHFKSKLETGEINLLTELVNTNKVQSLSDIMSICNMNNINFEQLIKRTNLTDRNIKVGSRYFVDVDDIKVAERVLAFYNLNLIDPVKYANEKGVLTWEEVLSRYGVGTSVDDLGLLTLNEIESTPIKNEVVVEEVVEVFVPESPVAPRQYVNVIV
jgi:hypothetical protein